MLGGLLAVKQSIARRAVYIRFINLGVYFLLEQS